jgi:SOS response regulatory protein OraA/RecX
MDLLNDKRYAELWLKQKTTYGGKGPRLLLAALQNRGIPSKTAQAALDAALTADTERALLQRCLEKAQKKFRQNQNKDVTRHFLKAQGFSGAAIEEYFEN